MFGVALKLMLCTEFKGNLYVFFKVNVSISYRNVI